MTLFKHIESVLEQNESFCNNGKLFKNTVVEAGLKLDPELLTLLLKDEKAKKHFFSEVGGITVFDKVKFQKFVSNKQFLPDSFTAFKNKIGLTANGEYLTEAREVVLDFPYKDCVLEGGQSQEEKGRTEVFWNTTLAPDEIDRLFEPKVLTNWKRYDEKGPQEVKKVSKSDNLILKGNNLLALHTILPLYKRKIKLIYIDPPYNTGNDSFKYNDSFNHSSWLTFMKNRLQVAKDLLSEDGSIWINIDDKELAYLMVLCDDIFGSENFLNLTSIKRSAATGHKSINPSPISVTDYLVGYAKIKGRWVYNKTYTKREYDRAYNKFIVNYSENYSEWKIITIKEALRTLKINNEESLIKKYPDQVIRFAVPDYLSVGKDTRRLIDNSKQEPSKIFRQQRDNHLDIYVLNGQRILFYRNKLRKIDGEVVTSEPLTNFWDDIPFQGIAGEGGVVLKKGKKPEKLLKRIIEFSTEPGDIVLDFFLGSGTTAAVSLKLGRQFIGIEQLFYGKNDAVNRLQKCINGDKSGVSKVVNWKGGGDFLYAELYTQNMAYIHKVQSTDDAKGLENVFEQIGDSEFVKYNLDIENLRKNKDVFSGLDISEKKFLLLELLDMNYLYINYTEIADISNNIPKDVRKLNHQFYGLV